MFSAFLRATFYRGREWQEYGFGFVVNPILPLRRRPGMAGCARRQRVGRAQYGIGRPIHIPPIACLYSTDEVILVYVLLPVLPVYLHKCAHFRISAHDL